MLSIINTLIHLQFLIYQFYDVTMDTKCPVIPNYLIDQS